MIDFKNWSFERLFSFGIAVPLSAAFAVGFILTFALPPPKEANAQVFGPTIRTPQLTVSPGDTSVQNLTINGTCTGCPTSPPGGTTGQIQFNNASVFGGIAEGTSGQVLTSNGAGVSPSFANPGVAITCTATCDLTGLLVGQSAIIRKPTTQSVTSSTTLAGDNELAFSNAPAGGYIIEGMYSVTDGGGGVRVGFSASGVRVTGNASCAGVGSVMTVTTTNPGAMQCATPATSVFTYQGIITRGSAGSITVLFAQQASNAGATTMGVDSFVMLTRYY